MPNLISYRNAKYITVQNENIFNQERALTQGTNVSIDDAGPNSTITLNVPDGTTSTKGAVELATDSENAANVVVQGNDTRLSDSRAPTGSAGGDLTGSSYPNPVVSNDAISNAKLANMAANTIKGNSTGSTADPSDISVGTNTVLGRQASNIVSAQVATGQIANDAVDNTKLSNMTGFTVKAKPTTGTGDPSDLSVGTNTVVGRASGDVVAAQLVNAQITNSTIQYAKVQNVTDNRILGRNAGTSGSIQEISVGNGLYLNSQVLNFDYIEHAKRKVGFIDDFIEQGDAKYYTYFANHGSFGGFIINYDVQETGIFGAITLHTADNTYYSVITPDSVWLTSSMMILGQGIVILEGKVKIHTLSNGTDRYKIIFGYTDDPDTTTVNDGIWIEYSDVDSANWRYCTANDATRTQNNSSISVSANTWVRLKIVINAAASSVEYFVNDTSLGTITTNIPAATDDGVTITTGIYKSIGTTQSNYSIDYIAFQIDLTSMR